MDFYTIPVTRERRRVFEWHSRFGHRVRRAYAAEDRKLTPKAHQTIMDAFFAELASRLDPPQHNFTSLRKFLGKANDTDLHSQTSSASQGLILLDDRRDNTGWLGTDAEVHSARDWDGYIEYPPEGENATVLLLDPQGLYRRQSESVGSYVLYYLRHY